MNCYLSRNYKNLDGAGNKAKTDIEKIMERAGFRNVGLKQSNFTNPVLDFLFTLFGVLKSPFYLHENDILFLQYPLKKYFSFVCKLAHFRNSKVVVIIHDLGCFRRKKLTVEKEIRRLNRADYIIAHNPSMKAFLLQNGCKARIGELGIFDYLAVAPVTEVIGPCPPFNVVYAGALSERKNKFLYELGSYIHSYIFRLFGNGFESSKAIENERLNYHGFISSEQMIAHPQGHFGLVWDGASIHTCSGNFGEYLRYNNPHKTSFYLRCGMPVIIWKQAALASFIERNGAGFCIESLEEIDNILKSLTSEDYRKLKENACKIGMKLSKGHFITEALKTAERELVAGN
ncbi:MAG: galactofuranosyltransferase [Parabacteroides sp.]|nr:galactofuranosyltransferase [Parabacteroides sp.]